MNKKTTGLSIAYQKIRKPTAPPTSNHGDDKKYSRKTKHKEKF